MIYHIDITPRLFHFKQPAGTSRGVYLTRKSWMVEITSQQLPGRKGVGECAPLPDLSVDFRPDYEAVLRQWCDRMEQEGEGVLDEMQAWPSMRFGLETALLHLQRGTTALFDTPFARSEVGIPINGLVWMGSHDEMLKRVEEKLQQGFHCIKLKVGAIDFEQELDLVKRIRERFAPAEMEIRLDANGGFKTDEALDKLERFAQYAIHSIEQPIKQHQWGNMAKLCRDAPLPIALDEELIGLNHPEQKQHMLDTIKPQYIVIKPTLHGGITGSIEWVSHAQKRGIGTWMTSALESNIGLRNVALLAASLYGPRCTLAQGLGTGQLYTDNIEMDIEMRRNKLWRSPIAQ